MKPAAFLVALVVACPAVADDAAPTLANPYRTVDTCPTFSCAVDRAIAAVCQARMAQKAAEQAVINFTPETWLVDRINLVRSLEQLSERVGSTEQTYQALAARPFDPALCE